MSTNKKRTMAPNSDAHVQSAHIVFGTVVLNPLFIDVLEMVRTGTSDEWSVVAATNVDDAHGPIKYKPFTRLSLVQASAVLRAYARWRKGGVKAQTLENELLAIADSVALAKQ